MSKAPSALARLGRTLVGLGFAAALAACSTLPPRPALPETHALAADVPTPLSAMTERALPGDTRSGFRLLPYGPNALAARLALAERATKTLDVQYYQLAADDTGVSLMRSLRQAAERGVRVRILVDDLYTSGEDDVLLAMAAVPNVEVRLFNPFPGGRGAWLTRFIASAWEFDRVDRRMHNKLFVADNAAAITGGRNMADAYVMNAPGSNFIDLDVFAAGPVVRELSGAFDRYWNSPVVYPVQSIARATLSPEALRRELDRRMDGARAPETADPDDQGRLGPIGGEAPEAPPQLISMLSLHLELRRGRLGPLLPAFARVLVDPPEKRAAANDTPLEASDDAIGGTVTQGVIRWLLGAQKSVKLISPYFVPNAQGLVYLGRARKAGLGVVVITNSLASTDEPFAWAEYARHTKALLEMGVELYELSPSLSVSRRRLGLIGPRRGALHLKEAIRDDAQVFLGSMNLDPRSAWLNTEIGLVIESTEMAGQLHAMGDRASDYQLRLGPDGEVEWVSVDDAGRETVFHEPPETTRWLRFKLWLLSRLVPKGEL